MLAGPNGYLIKGLRLTSRSQVPDVYGFLGWVHGFCCVWVRIFYRAHSGTTIHPNTVHGLGSAILQVDGVRPTIRDGRVEVVSPRADKVLDFGGRSRRARLILHIS